MREGVKNLTGWAVTSALALLTLEAGEAGGVNSANPQDVVINEVAWMGTAASPSDEWIELYNTTDQPIDLTGWTLEAADGTPLIPLSGTIPPKGFFLLERTDEDTVSDIPADQVYGNDGPSWALKNTGETLLLKDPAGNVIDTANGDGGPWPAGDNTTKSTMERIDPLAPDTDANWATNNGLDRNGLDAGTPPNPINGTPKALNSTVNEPPIADAGPDQTADEGDPVSLDGSASFDPDHDPLTCTWDPGDGSPPLDGCTLTHVYVDNGVYTATLTVADGRGGTAQDTVQIAVQNVPPTVEAGPDRTADVGQLLSFQGAFTDPSPVDTHTIEWDFGDGTTAAGTLTPTHSYAAAGVYTVILTVTDDDGGVGQDQLTVTVNAPVLAATKRLLETGPWVEVGEELAYEIVITNTGNALQPDNPEPELRDPLPPNTTFVEGSLTATSGTASFDAVHERVLWDGSLTPGESVILTFRVRIDPVPTGTVIENQGEALYDADGDGSNESSRPTDDPTTPEPDDPTRSPPVVQRGDPNGDGVIDLRDAVLCAEGALALRALTELEEVACDVVPPSGAVDGRDAVRIAEIALGISPARARIGGQGVTDVELLELRWENLVLAPGERRTLRLYAQNARVKGLQLGPAGAIRFDPRTIRVLEVRAVEPYHLLASRVDNVRGFVKALLVRWEDPTVTVTAAAGEDNGTPIPLLEVEVEAVGRPGLQMLLRTEPDLALDAQLNAASVRVEGGRVRIGPAMPLVVERFVVRPLGAGMAGREGYRFSVEGRGVRAIAVWIFDVQGKTVFQSGDVANGFVWRGWNAQGGRLANGVYLYVMTVYGSRGEVLRSEIRKLVLLR